MSSLNSSNSNVSILKGPSEHLSWNELKCKDGTPYPEEFIKDGRVFQLASIFETIRYYCGDKPIKVYSAYRTPSHNRKVGGAKNSQHLYGNALDLALPHGMTVTNFYRLIHSNASELGIGGIGHYPTFVHIDIRKASKLVGWNGNGIKDTRINT